MSHSALFAPFMRVALFQNLKPIQITEIAHHGERIVFRDGDVILREGREGDAAYLIVSGQVQRLDPVADKDNTSDEALERRTDIETPPGTLLGEMSMLIDGHEHGATIIAKGSVRAFKLSRAAIHAQMEADPDLADHFVQIIAGRLRSVADELRRIDQTLAPKATPLAGRLTSSPAQHADTPSIS